MLYERDRFGGVISDVLQQNMKFIGGSMPEPGAGSEAWNFEMVFKKHNE